MALREELQHRRDTLHEIRSAGRIDQTAPNCIQVGVRRHEPTGCLSHPAVR
jgi:hypothetical protein